MLAYARNRRSVRSRAPGARAQCASGKKVDTARPWAPSGVWATRSVRLRMNKGSRSSVSKPRHLWQSSNCCAGPLRGIYRAAERRNVNWKETCRPVLRMCTTGGQGGLMPIEKPGMHSLTPRPQSKGREELGGAHGHEGKQQWHERATLRFSRLLLSTALPRYAGSPRKVAQPRH